MSIYFGENLKKLRHKRNLTQEKLAEFLGVSFQSISKCAVKEIFYHLYCSFCIFITSQRALS
jgi:predicted transcriptional regulator